jgi:hypothetical protein
MPARTSYVDRRPSPKCISTACARKVEGVRITHRNHPGEKAVAQVSREVAASVERAYMASGEPTCGPRRGDGKFVGRQSGDRARLRSIRASAMPFGHSIPPRAISECDADQGWFCVLKSPTVHHSWRSPLGAAPRLFFNSASVRLCAAVGPYSVPGREPLPLKSAASVLSR